MSVEYVPWQEFKSRLLVVNVLTSYGTVQYEYCKS